MTDRTDHLAASVQAIVNGRLAEAREQGRREGRQEAGQAPDALLDGAMHSVWLHGNWQWLTTQMTTPEKDAAADAVLRHSAVLDNGIGEPLSDADLRWWRQP